MPQTHPQYQLYADDGDWFRPSCDIDVYGLDAAIAQAADMTAMSMFNTYSVQPVPGTEPRYRIMTSSGYLDPRYVAGVFESHWGGYQTHTWAEARAIYEDWCQHSHRARRAALYVVPA